MVRDELSVGRPVAAKAPAGSIDPGEEDRDM